MKNNKRSLFILKFLTEQTDEKHLATITNINEYLRQYDLDANRETISDCMQILTPDRARDEFQGIVDKYVQLNMKI